METDLLIPLIWTFVFGSLLVLGVRRLSKKAPVKKRWVRPEPDNKKKDQN
tara:strand:+ start:402 stop:551 length:150 start_codon:yes stop_codon:yes gene_type:complete